MMLLTLKGDFNSLWINIKNFFINIWQNIEGFFLKYLSQQTFNIILLALIISSLAIISIIYNPPYQLV